MKKGYVLRNHQPWKYGHISTCLSFHVIIIFSSGAHLPFSVISLFTCLLNIFYNFLFFFFFRAAPTAYGSSQGSNRRYSCQPRPQPRQHRIWATSTSVTYTTGHSNAGSLRHWSRPGIKPTSSWILIGILTWWATMGIPYFL